MKQRVITAIIALLVFVPVVWYGGPLFQLVVALMGIIGVYELFKMKGLSVLSIPGVLSALATVALILPRQNWFEFLPYNINNFHLFIVIMMLLLCMTVFSKNEFNFEEVGFPVLTSLYVGVGFQHFVLARGNDSQFLFIIYGLAVVWSTDIGAYMVGRKLGKNKLAPHISPNKTIEGSIGGIICAIIAGLLVIALNPSGTTLAYSWPVMIPITILLSIAGQMGDLVESAFKRFYGVKDSGKLLPGHGGILDRFDSLLFVFPLMYILGLFS